MADKKKKANKSSSTELKLPNISRSISRSNEMKQARENYKFMWSAIIFVILSLIVLFVLLGGINQRKFFESMVEFSQNIGRFFIDLFKGSDVEIGNDGIYWRP